MEDSGAVEALHAWDVGYRVGDAGGEEEFAGLEDGAVVDGDFKTCVDLARCANMKATVLNFIARQLLARDASKLRGVDSVSGEKSVDGPGGFVAVISVIEDHDAPPCASEDRSSAQTSGASAHDNHVVRHVCGRKTRTGEGTAGPLEKV